jgi:hypothetical protein
MEDAMAETIHVTGGKIIEPSPCAVCRGRMMGGPDGQFKFQCEHCGSRLVVWTFPDNPDIPVLYVWESECPPGTDFDEYTGNCIAAHIAALSKRPDAAPG